MIDQKDRKSKKSCFTDLIYLESKTERMQLVLRPSVKAFIKEAAAHDHVSANEFIERLVLQERDNRKS